MSLKIAIVGYKVKLVGKWSPDDTINGLPGSEECAVYASEELAKQGHIVHVYMEPPSKSKWKSKESNPRWFDVDDWIDKSKRPGAKQMEEHNAGEIYDLVLLWRRYDVNFGRIRGKKVFLWPHDCPYPAVGNKIFPKFDGILFLSESQRKQYQNEWLEVDTIPYTICGNGLVPEQFPVEIKERKNPYSIGYFSNYARGLICLILLWPEIKTKYPTATLDIYYGRETWNTMPEQQFNFLISKIEQFKQFGINEKGKVGHLELAKAMSELSIWAYPCLSQAETFCITAIKAQAAGMIPVTTRLAALDETVHPDAPSIKIINNNNDLPQYRDLLFSVFDRIKDEPNIQEERKKYSKFGLQFTWNTAINKWLSLYNNI